MSTPKTVQFKGAVYRLAHETIHGHQGVEYAVDDAAGKERTFKTFDDAAGFAVALAASGRAVNLDILVYSEEGARQLGGDGAVEQYREDPDASVFERLEIKVNSVGRVP